MPLLFKVDIRDSAKSPKYVVAGSLGEVAGVLGIRDDRITCITNMGAVRISQQVLEAGAKELDNQSERQDHMH